MSFLFLRRLTKVASLGVWAAFILLFIFPVTAYAVDRVTATEVGGEAGDSPGPSWADLKTELMFSVVGTKFDNDDLELTYGYQPAIGFGASFSVGRTGSLFVSVHYGRQTGKPYYDITGFDNVESNVLQTIPFAWGLRANLTPSSRVRVLAGVGAQLTYVREKSVAEFQGRSLGTTTSTGLIMGYKFAFGPELRSRDLSWALGLEMGLSVGYGEVTSGSAIHDIDLTGFTTRLYYTFML